MGKLSREKGARGEREIASILRSYGYEARRGCQYHGGADSPDVVGLPGIHLEVKWVEAFRIYDAIDQAKRDAAPGELPVVMYKKNNHRWLAIMELEPGFMELYREWKGALNNE